jgi:hypothetical protein
MVGQVFRTVHVATPLAILVALTLNRRPKAPVRRQMPQRVRKWATSAFSCPVRNQVSGRTIVLAGTS